MVPTAQERINHFLRQVKLEESKGKFIHDRVCR
jgi:hypothetical protein